MICHNRFNIKKAPQIILLLILIFLGSCKKEKSCTVFSQQDLEFIPYHEYDTLTFNNQENEIILIFIKEFKFSESYTVEYKSLFGVKEEACINYIELWASDSKNTDEYVFLKMEQSDMSEMQYFNYQLLDFYFEIDFDNEVPYINQFDYMELVPSLTINNTLYNDVIMYRDITNSSGTIQSVYLNKSDGILKFTIDGTGDEWVKSN